MKPGWTEHLVAAIDLLGRTGAQEVQVRYSDDEEPTVWMVVARYSVQRPGDAFPTRTFQAAGGMTPDEAAYRLVEQMLDGGLCRHCGRQTAVEQRWDDAELLAELAAVGACVYAYDPEIKKYRRACEDGTIPRSTP